MLKGSVDYKHTTGCEHAQECIHTHKNMWISTNHFTKLQSKVQFYPKRIEDKYIKTSVSR